MGLRTNTVPAPIVLQQPQQQQSENTDAPNITPMRPTPLVGDWCDVPCPWTDDKGEPMPQQPMKRGAHGGAATPQPPQYSQQYSIAHDGQQQQQHSGIMDKATPQSSESQRTDEDDANNSNTAYIGGVSPSASWQATDHNNNSSTNVIENWEQSKQQQALRAQQQKRTRLHKRPMQQEQILAPRSLQQPVLVSRFLPPPPPGVVVCTTLLQNGSPFERYYAIVMRWYAAVLVAQQFHREMPQCPRAEDYVYDFDGWVVQISQWWERNIGSRAPPHQRRR